MPTALPGRERGRLRRGPDRTGGEGTDKGIGAVAGFVVSHELPLAQAPQAYEKFDRRVEGYTKVVPHPVLAV
ncbi:hypothetical protein [Streptomyces sp. NPDC056669]|uniref:hypothetical protein n=1 Tax=unclassified Streptomyces TaxID=2593676 RepID=UPI003699DDAA